jgi:hypothetical protein
MTQMYAGTGAWWFRHECRVSFREAVAEFGPAAMFVGLNMAAGVYIGLHVAAFFVIQYLNEYNQDYISQLCGYLPLVAFFACLVRGVSTFSQAMTRRNDSSWLTSTPVDLVLIFRARIFAGYITCIAFPLYCLSPILMILVVCKGAAFIPLYLFVLSVSIIAATISLTAVLILPSRIMKWGAKEVARIILFVAMLCAVLDKTRLMDGRLDIWAVAGIQHLERWSRNVSQQSSAVITVFAFAIISAVYVAQGLLKIDAIKHARASGRKSAITLTPTPKVSRAFAWPKKLWSPALIVALTTWRRFHRRPSSLANLAVNGVLVAASVVLICIDRHISPSITFAVIAVYLCGHLTFEMAYGAAPRYSLQWLIKSAPISYWKLACYEGTAISAPMMIFVWTIAAFLAFFDLRLSIRTALFGSLSVLLSAAIGFAPSAVNRRNYATPSHQSPARVSTTLVITICMVCAILVAY